MRGFSNYTDCIRSNNRDSIEQALTQILEQEGCRRISPPPQPISNEGLFHNPWQLLCNLWIISLFDGIPGWTIVKTEPNELLCRRAKGADRPRLSELAMQIGGDAFHLGVYDGHYGILLEADATGRTFISGAVDRPEEEKDNFYDEQINKRGYSEFFLLDAPEEIRAVVKAPSPEEEEEQDRRLKELKELDRLTEEAGEQLFDIEAEMEELLKGNAQRIDEALALMVGGSHSYWYLRDNLFYLAYTQQQQLEADGVRLLYFQPAEHYQQLDPLYEIEGHY